MRTFVVPLWFFAAAASAAQGEGIVPPGEFVHCTTCHGVQLMGNATLNAPRLSDMDAWYVERQLEAYKSGWRGDHPDDAVGRSMRTVALALTDEQVVAAAEYVAATRSPPPALTGSGDAERGAALYQSCAACHGSAGEGSESTASPRLTGLNDWYLVRQLNSYRNGWRGAHADDTYGQQMRGAVGMLAYDAAVTDVVAYIVSLDSDTDLEVQPDD